MKYPQGMLMRLVFIANVVVIASLIIGAMACGGMTQRERSLRSSFIAVNSARVGFQTWDATHQASIVAEASTETAAIAQLADYRDKRMNVIAAFEAAYHSIALAAVDDKLSAEAIAELVALEKALSSLRADVGD